jgi:L-lysine 6-transaminase
MRRSLTKLSKLNSLKSTVLVDSYPKLWNFYKSTGSHLVDSNDTIHLDFHGGFGSNPIGWNHHKLSKRLVKQENLPIFVNKPANSDFYSEEYANFTEKFKSIIPKKYDKLFFIDGGALAVENALKVAFDWKYHKTGRKDDDNYNPQVIYLEKAFHGRSGYTMSLTNTEPFKVAHFPKFRDWIKFTDVPHTLKVKSAEEAKEITKKKLEEIKKNNNLANVAAFIVEPIQCEGGDRHLHESFLKEVNNFCKKNDILFIVDEVQTGFFTSGKPWCFEY